MISFRYHIVSIVSVFLALAIGIALGGGPLKGEVDNTLVDQVKMDRSVKSDLRAQIQQLKSTNQFTDDFAKQVAPTLLDGSLKGHTVDLVVLPGAEATTVTSLSDLVTTAGATLGGTLRVGNGLLDVSNKQLVDELGSQLEGSATGVNVPPDASGYERMGILIARAIGTQDTGGAQVDGTADSILAGLSTAGMMSAEGDLNRRGDLLLFVAGPGKGGSAESDGSDAIVTTLVTEADAGTNGVVLGGPVSSAQPGGAVRAVRDDVTAARDVSTVDTISRTAGQVVAVMALNGQAHGQSGQYGSVDAADGPMPGAKNATD